MSPSPHASASDSSEDPSGEGMPLLELEALLARPPSRRKRLRQLGCFLLAAVVALGVFWGNLAPHLPTARPRPSAAPPGLLITSNVNAATLTINGQTYSGPLPMVAVLHGDRSTIRLEAPPFLPKTCQIQVSQPDSSDAHTCQGVALSLTNPVRIQGVAVTLVFQLDLFLTLDDLPPDQQRQVTDVLTQVVHAQQDVLVPPGSYIATGLDSSGEIVSQRTTAPQVASASLEPFTPQSQEFFPCAGFICAGGIQTQPASRFADTQWDILVLMVLRWHVRSISGAVSSDVRFPPAHPLHVFLSYQGTEGWSVASAPAPEGSITTQVASTWCVIGQAMLRRMGRTAAATTIEVVFDRGAAGCELVLEQDTGAQGRFLWRLGVLLAVDTQAHATYPDLPRAPSAEIAAIEHP